MLVENAIYGRRSIRTFSDERVDTEDMKKIILAGMHAPSACNFQAWKFIIIDNDDVKDRIVFWGGVSNYKKGPSGYFGCV